MTSKKSKKPSLPPESQPTTAWWTREDYVKRRTHWMWRLRPYILKKYEDCKVCEFNSRCHRVPCNEPITSQILKGKKCPDFKSVWNKILGDGKKYDWGF